jgi:hypothetical protein
VLNLTSTHTGGMRRGEHIWAIKFERVYQQSLDPQEGAQGLNTSLVYRRVDFVNSKSYEKIGTVHRERIGGSIFHRIGYQKI